MKKAIRGGRVLIDWSQNNGAKTTIAPVLAARPRAPERRRAAHVGRARRPRPRAAVVRGGARARRDDRRPAVGPRLSTPAAATADDGPLSTYIAKRTAGKTPEPVPSDPAAAATPAGELPIFVIQEHHATALHWDFRLERDGVLVSWAVPRGVPHSYKRNNLAIMTEDHPMDYATFEGTIPAGEYGGGSVTIWDDGRYELEKWRDDEVIATARGAPRRSARPRAARADPHRRPGREVDLAAAPHEDRHRRARATRRRAGRAIRAGATEPRRDGARARRRRVRPRRRATTDGLAAREVRAAAAQASRSPATPAPTRRCAGRRPPTRCGRCCRRARRPSAPSSPRASGATRLGGGEVGRHPRGRACGTARGCASCARSGNDITCEVPRADRGRRRARRRAGDRRRRDRRDRRARAARASRCCRRA